MKKIYLLMIVFGIWLSACKPTTTPQVTETSPYPMGEVQVYPTNTYPPPGYTYEFVYPAPGETGPTQQAGKEGVIPFQIAKPVLPGAEQVSGTGLPGVPIQLINVTTVGDILGETTIQEDGTFIFQIQPVEAGTRIGVAVGDLDGTSWAVEDFYDPGYNGDEAMNVPMVGFLWDTTLVKEK